VQLARTVSILMMIGSRYIRVRVTVTLAEVFALSVHVNISSVLFLCYLLLVIVDREVQYVVLMTIASMSVKRQVSRLHCHSTLYHFSL